MTRDDVTLTADVGYGTVDGTTLRLDYAVAAAAGSRAAGGGRPRGLPVVMYIHGGAWLFGDRAGAAERERMFALAAEGFFSVSVGYRFSAVALFPAQIRDIWSAVQWLRSEGPGLGADPSRIGAWGHSAGGHLAALLGLTASVRELGGAGMPIQAVVPVSAPTNLFAMGGTHDDPDSPESKLIGSRIRTSRALADRASPVTYAAAAKGRVLPPYMIVHGTADTVVPFSQAEELHRSLPASTLLAVGGADHDFKGGSLGWEEITNAATAFFRRHLA